MSSRDEVDSKLAECRIEALINDLKKLDANDPCAIRRLLWTFQANEMAAAGRRQWAYLFDKFKTADRYAAADFAAHGWTIQSITMEKSNQHVVFKVAGSKEAK